MKNNIINLCLSLILLVFCNSCAEDDYEIGEIIAPSNLSVSSEIVGQSEEFPYGDGSGLVRFAVSANNAMTYKFFYGDGFEEVSHDGTTEHPFNTNGINDYTVTVIATGTGGASSNMTTVVTVFSNFSDPETEELLTGGSTKTWYIAAAVPGHLGVGPSEGADFGSPIHYAAGPFEKAAKPISACIYDVEMTFKMNGDKVEYLQDNKGATFFNASYGPDFGGSGAEDECLSFDTSGVQTVSLSPSTSGLPEDQTTGTVMNISGGGFLGYYIGASSYEILNIDENNMYVRAIMGNDPTLAWYLRLTTSQDQGGEEPEEFISEYNDLLWEENFDTDGTPDPEIWNFETGNNDGWGNQEAQFYTEDNAVVAEGNLVITAKKEAVQGYDYSSSRITTEDNFEFQYGRVEVRAKLPTGAGTWPAIWMLGSNYAEAGWPDSGEIDIMEHVGNSQNEIHGTLHYPGRSGGNADTGTLMVDNVSSEFHNYSLEWSPERIVFLVDEKVVHSYINTADSPFHQKFFLILNVAMGGTFGGQIDPAFAESEMVVDYVKVFQ